jgi:hypothetical protein
MKSFAPQIRSERKRRASLRMTMAAGAALRVRRDLRHISSERENGQAIAGPQPLADKVGGS